MKADEVGDHKEAKRKYGIELKPFELVGKYNAAIIAVSHSK